MCRQLFFFCALVGCAQMQLACEEPTATPQKVDAAASLSAEGAPPTKAEQDSSRQGIVLSLRGVLWDVPSGSASWKASLFRGDRFTLRQSVDRHEEHVDVDMDEQHRLNLFDYEEPTNPWGEFSERQQELMEASKYGYIKKAQAFVGAYQEVTVLEDRPLFVRPSNAAERRQTVSTGTHLIVVEQKESWLQVVLPNRRKGWMREDDISRDQAEVDAALLAVQYQGLTAKEGKEHIAESILNDARSAHPTSKVLKAQGLLPYSLDDLMQAAEDGKLPKVKEIVATGVPANQASDKGDSALQRAATAKKFGVVRFLLKETVKKDDPAVALALADAVAGDGLEGVKQLVKAGAAVDAKDAQGETALTRAATAGDKEICAFLIGKGAQVSHTTLHKRTPLHMAAQGGFLEVARLLLDKGADATLADSAGVTPVMEAAASGDKALVALLVTKGADVNQQSPRAKFAHFDAPMGKPVLAYAIESGHRDALQVLLEAGADPNAANALGYTPVMFAVKSKQPQLVSLLVEFKADLNAVTKKGFNALDMAAAAGELELAKLLLQKGIGFSGEEHRGVTALHGAAKAGYREMVDFLLSKELAVDLADRDKKTALMVAADSGHAEVVSLLLAKGAEVNAVDSQDRTALFFAAVRGEREVVQALLQGKAEINSQNSSKTTPLIAAISGRHWLLAKELIDGGASVNLVQDDGSTALSRSVALKSEVLVQLLLDQGADPNVKLQHQQTPLMWAAGKKCNPVNMKALLAKNADTTAVDDKGNTALIYAVKHATLGVLPDVIQTLVSHGAAVNAKNKKGKTAFFLAVDRDRWKEAAQLLELGADSEDKALFSPVLLAAVRKGKTEVIEGLLKRGADVNAKDSKGRSALDLAVDRNQWELFVKLLKGGADAPNADQYQAYLNKAIASGERSAVSLLMKKIGNVDIDAALLVAVAKGQQEMARLFLDKGAQVNAQDQDGKTPLIHAARADNVEMAKMLLEHRAKVNMRDSKRRSALIWNAYNHCEGQVGELLLEAGAKENFRDSDGQKAEDYTERCYEDHGY